MNNKGSSSKSKPLVIIQTYENRNSAKETVVQQTINDRLSSFNQRETPQEKSSTSVTRKGSNASTVLSPPPPPPLPLPEVDEVDSAKSTTQPKQKLKAPPPPVPQKVPQTIQPPPCPTPDYDNLSISSTSTLPKKSSMNGFIKKELNKSLSHNGHPTPSELESLELSFNKLNQQNGTSTPKTQNFHLRPKSSSASPNIQQNGAVLNGTLTKQRPVSVIIGEYPSGTSRKQPKKLDFLSNRDNGGKSQNNESIVSQFASELAQTLNRSNLRKKTESMTNGD